MAVDLSSYLVAGVSSRALFDLTLENKIFEEQGVQSYTEYQLANENLPLPPGPAFPLIRALLHLNEVAEEKIVDVVVMSRNSTETALRVDNSIKHHNLDISRMVFTSGEPLAPYLAAFSVSLFLSFDEGDVQTAIDNGFAAAHIFGSPEIQNQNLTQIRIAFDGDAVLFNEDSERVYQSKGLEAFAKYEAENANTPLLDGPFASFLRKLAELQQRFSHLTPSPIRTALVTARGGDANERVIKTLQSWKINIDESFFLNGASKRKVIQAFSPHMFFDDQITHCEDASIIAPTGRVPWKSLKSKNE